MNVDEAACNNKTTVRNRGYSQVGKRATISSFLVRGKRITVEMGISCTGLVAYQLYEGSMDGGDFIAYIKYLV